jgi:hypothetical protein
VSRFTLGKNISHVRRILRFRLSRCGDAGKGVAKWGDATLSFVSGLFSAKSGQRIPARTSVGHAAGRHRFAERFRDVSPL